MTKRLAQTLSASARHRVCWKTAIYSASFRVEDNLVIAERYGRAANGIGIAFTFDDVYELFPVVADRRSQRVELLSGGG
ncbi:hypothetical protein CWO89_36280 [Bradyrhizobium sp. Leo170]|nr:hypothetical protein CWO89_36280 [Bradyrhizobium sp. Leo170]